MANPHKGELTFEADGATYTLHYSSDAICNMEDKLDRSFTSISIELTQGAKAPEKIRFGLLRVIFWAGLQDHHPGTDLKTAGDLMIRAGGLTRGLELISEAFTRAFPAPEMKDARPPKGDQAKSGTGRAS